jgi:hypothetical protein
MADRYRLYKSASPCCDAPSPWLRRCRYRGQSVCSGGRAPLEWELVEVDDALRPPAGASKVHESFWMPHCRGNRGSRAGQPTELIAGPIMDAVMRQIGQEGYKRTPPISLFSPSLWFHEPRRHSAFRAIHRVRLYAHHLRAYSRKSSLV